MKVRAAIGMPWLCLAALTFGNLAAAGTPEDAVRAYMVAYQQGGAKTVAASIHPAELVRFKDMLMPMFRSASAADFQQVASMFFGKDVTLAKLEATPPQEFMSGFRSLMDQQTKGLKISSFEVLGNVPEKEFAHVVTRITMEGANNIRITKMTVVSTLRFEKDWKLALTGEMENLARALSAK